MARTRHFYIEGLILKKARQTFKGSVTRKNFDVYTEHWMRAAQLLRQEFEAEGLMTSVGYVDDVIRFNTPRVKEPDRHSGSEIHRLANGWSARQEFGFVTFSQESSRPGDCLLSQDSWVLRDKNNEALDIDKSRDALFARHPEFFMFEQVKEYA